MDELIGLITSQLGINDDQAKGGAGLLFKFVKDKLSDGDFGQITDLLGNADELISAAPAAGKASGLLGAVGGLMGGKADDLAGLAGLASGFKDLGLSGDMIGKFGGIIMDLVKSKGGDGVVGMIQGLLDGK